jgi:hypothetical protein
MRSNGTYVDLFINANASSTNNNGTITISDFGNTWDYLVDLDRPNWSNLQYLAASYGLKIDGRALSVTCEAHDFLQHLLKLAQACVAASVPASTEETEQLPTVHQASEELPALHRGTFLPDALPTPTTFKQVVQILYEVGRPFQQNAAVPIPLREQYEVHVDILVHSGRNNAALMIVEHSPYDKVTMRRADHAFAIHTDLKDGKWRGKRFSVVADKDLYKKDIADSFQRLDRISTLIGASDLRSEQIGLFG